MSIHFFILTIVILLAGIFGGIVNYFLFQHKNSDIVSLPRSIFVGAAAAFLVPVILFFIGSDLLIKSQLEPSQLILLASISLIAALVSCFFVLSTADQADDIAREARARVASLEHELNSLQQQLAPIFASETETQYNKESLEILPKSDDFDLSTTSVLQKLNMGPQIFRSVPGICLQSDFDETVVSKALLVLRQNGLAERMMSEQGVRWYITTLGQRYLYQFQCPLPH
jgi:hypothetical protein